MASAVAAGERPATVEAGPSPASSLGEAVDSLPPLTRTWSSGRPDTTMEVGDSVLNRAPDSLRLSKRSMRSMLSMDSGRTSMGDTDDAESVYEELAAREADLHVAAQAATALIEANQQLRTDCEALQARVSSLEEQLSEATQRGDEAGAERDAADHEVAHLRHLLRTTQAEEERRLADEKSQHEAAARAASAREEDLINTVGQLQSERDELTCKLVAEAASAAKWKAKAEAAAQHSEQVTNDMAQSIDKAESLASRVKLLETFLTQHGLPIPSDVGGQQAGDGSSEHSGDASGRHHHARRRSSFLLADALAKAKELEAENQRLRDELQEAEAFLHEQRRKHHNRMDSAISYGTRGHRGMDSVGSDIYMEAAEILRAAASDHASTHNVSSPTAEQGIRTCGRRPTAVHKRVGSATRPPLPRSPCAAGSCAPHNHHGGVPTPCQRPHVSVVVAPTLPPRGPPSNGPQQHTRRRKSLLDRLLCCVRSPHHHDDRMAMAHHSLQSPRSPAGFGVPYASPNTARAALGDRTPGSTKKGGPRHRVQLSDMSAGSFAQRNPMSSGPHAAYRPPPPGPTKVAQE